MTAAPEHARAGLRRRQLFGFGLGAIATAALVAAGFHVGSRIGLVCVFALYGFFAGLAIEVGRAVPRPRLVAQLSATWGLVGVAPAFGLRTSVEWLVISVVFLGHCLALSLVRNAATERIDGHEVAADPLRTGGMFLGLLATIAAGIALALPGYLWSFGTPAGGAVRMGILAFGWGTAAVVGLMAAGYVEPPAVVPPPRRKRPPQPCDEAAPDPPAAPVEIPTTTQVTSDLD